jgi:transcriptional regulator with XRE-family HTH domain
LDEVGSLLREAREAKGLTLAEAHEGTRINTRYLEALENGQYELLPTQVHIKGYLRNYARFLNLDPEPLLTRYELNQGARPGGPTANTEETVDSDRPIAPVEDQPFFDPVNVDISRGGKRGIGSSQRWIIIIALVISLALVGNRFIPLITGNGDGSEAITDGIQEAVSNLTNGENNEGTEESTPTATLVPLSGEVITSTSRNDPILLPTLTPTRPSLPATMESILLQLDITERSWMQVTIDGEVVFEGLARRGDEPYQWEALEQARLLSGNAAGIFVTVNDVELGKLGGRGDVVDETWTSTGEG